MYGYFNNVPKSGLYKPIDVFAEIIIAERIIHNICVGNALFFQITKTHLEHS